MSAILDVYQKQAQKVLSSLPWLAQMQTKALAQFNRHGFPTRHDEEWKYTPLDFLARQNFVNPQNSLKSSAVDASDLPVARQLNVCNGVLSGIPEWLQQLPRGVLIVPLSEAISRHTDLIKPHLGAIAAVDNAVLALNTALIHLGVFIYVPAGVCIEEPLALVHVQDQNNQALHLRHLIVAEAGSEIRVLEHYRGSPGCTYLTNTITEIYLGSHSKLTHHKVQQESKAAYHLGQVSVRQGAQSQFISHSLSLGARLARSDTFVYLQEEQAHCVLNGIYLPVEGQHVDHHTTVQHLVPNCRSDQDYKGILKGRSRAVFNGKVIVAKGAEHSDAKQQNKNLVLSPNAEMNTKPQLEIFADDVLCSHGATVGQLDEESLFYLATRGIDRQEASHYLIHAFAQDNLRLIADQAIANWMEYLVREQVEKK